VNQVGFSLDDCIETYGQQNIHFIELYLLVRDRALLKTKLNT